MKTKDFYKVIMFTAGKLEKESGKINKPMK